MIGNHLGIKELTKLQDDVTQFSFKEVESIIKDELRTSFSKIDFLETRKKKI